MLPHSLSRAQVTNVAFWRIFPVARTSGPDPIPAVWNRSQKRHFRPFNSDRPRIRQLP